MNLGNLYKNMGKNEESQQCYQKAQQLNPDLFKNGK
jgi:tetratricopeptide (TPR) repeat protein